MVSDKIKALILNRIDFADDELRDAVEDLTTAAAALASAGDQFDDVFPNDSGDAVADGVLTLADAFADVAAPDKNEVVKKAFRDVYSATTPEQEAAGEALFAAGLDFDLAANALNDFIDSRQVTE